jgi:hypothetical protein
MGAPDSGGRVFDCPHQAGSLLPSAATGRPTEPVELTSTPSRSKRIAEQPNARIERFYHGVNGGVGALQAERSMIFL